MSSVPQSSPPVIEEAVIAGMLLIALPWLKNHGFEAPSATKVLTTLETGRTQAYVMRSRLESELMDLHRAPGRPRKESQGEDSTETVHQKYALSKEVVSYLISHPGGASRPESRAGYSDDFKRFMLGLREKYDKLTLEDFSDAATIPAPTLKDWLRIDLPNTDDIPDTDVPDTDVPDTDVPDTDVPDTDVPDTDMPTMNSDMLAVFEAYSRWTGAFAPFCRHVKEQLGINHGTDWVRSLLFATGQRKRDKRSGSSREAEAMRGFFKVFFPNAQWVGDGTELEVELNGKLYKVNLELFVDAFSGAFVGASVSKTEDAQAVKDAFADAIDSTGTRPIALLLDNKPSNHAADVVDYVTPTDVMASTPGRAENKAHIEGGFGLLKQDVARLVVSGQTHEELAQSIAVLMVTVWGRAINHRPRKDRGGRTRAQLLQDPVLEKDRTAALAWFKEITERQNKARTTLAARQDPKARQAIEDALKRLELEDETGNMVTAMASFPMSAITTGIGIFEGKHRAGTLPDGVGTRYLRGIIRNVSKANEIEEIALAVWDERRKAQDGFVREKERHRDAILTSGRPVLNPLLEQALRAPSYTESLFWLDSIVAQVTHLPSAQHRQRYERIIRRIKTYFDVPPRMRLRAALYIATILVALP